MWNGNLVIYNGYVFPLWIYGSVYGALRGMGRSGVPMILSIIGTVGTRIVWIFWIFPNHRSLDILFISYPASLDHNNRITGDLLLLCEKTIICKMRAEA